MAHFTSQRRTPQRRGARVYAVEAHASVTLEKKNNDNNNVQRGTERGTWDSHSTFCAHYHHWQLLMGEWEKRKGERGSGERLINRGSVELRGGENFERNSQIEKSKRKKKNEEEEKNEQTELYFLFYRQGRCTAPSRILYRRHMYTGLVVLAR